MTATAIVMNFFLRVCTRFISAMKLQFITIFHPVFLQVPLLLLLTYGSCNYLPVCFLSKIIEPMGLKWYCARWIEASKPFSDYYVTLLWFGIHFLWNFKFVYGETFLDTDETYVFDWDLKQLSCSRIDSISPVMNGMAIEQSIIVFQSSIGRKV